MGTSQNIEMQTNDSYSHPTVKQKPIEPADYETPVPSSEVTTDTPDNIEMETNTAYGPQLQPLYETPDYDSAVTLDTTSQNIVMETSNTAYDHPVEETESQEDVADYETPVPNGEVTDNAL